MFTKTILSQHRNDYTAIMKCEHCGHEQKDPYGYADRNYIENIIPKMYCQGCNKNRAGEIKQTEVS